MSVTRFSLSLSVGTDSWLIVYIEFNSRSEIGMFGIVYNTYRSTYQRFKLQLIFFRNVS